MEQLDIFQQIQTYLDLMSGAERFQSLAYIAAALLFILALAGLSQQKSARGGNLAGIVGMTAALIATIVVVAIASVIPNLGSLSGFDVLHALEAALEEGMSQAWITLGLILLALLVGAVIGILKAKRVKMTEMPELVALLHSFVGAAAVLVGIGSFLTAPGDGTYEGAFHMGEVGLAVFIGAVTFTGSIIANLKLSARISGKPLMLLARNALNLAMLIACVVCIGWFIATRGVDQGALPLIILTIISLVLGAHLVLAIGGGDMPVVISMLNSYSGWAAAMAGFTLGNDLLIIAGALVGSSGAYLSYIMCKGMNRSFASVILGGFGSDGAATSSSQMSTGSEGSRVHTEVSPEQVAELLKNAKSVVVSPGYGMAVAQAQFPVAELARKLIDRGVDVKFAIHPVAGRMPGHMNVLLAEAKVPYDHVYEMDEVNDDFGDVDVVLVIGANDTVNPSAETDQNSPIAGMPVMRVWDAGKVIVSKRSIGNAGYAGVENPLFYNDNTDMLLGDAKDSVEAVIKALGS